MGSFIFSSSFLTGLEEVDDQHRRLVELTNEFEDSLDSAEDNPDKMDHIFTELAEYSQYHFETEETMMQTVKIDQRHYDFHRSEHHGFLQDVTQMQADTASDSEKKTSQLLQFLTHWMAYHILGCDKNMAKQVDAIQSGINSSEAYEMMERELDSSTEPLLNAINNLFKLVSARNKELRELNQSLEMKVEERTRDLNEANRHLVEISLTDTLTRLPNRRHAMQQLNAFWDESTRDGTPVSLMMIDADHFKEVNDTYGHDAGDEVLCELAKTLQHNVRTDDLVCRLGGDEFLVICPSTGEEGGLHIAQILRDKVSQMRVPTGDGFWQGSISVGIATRKNDMPNFDALIKAADDGVYEAKRAGKNCVRTPVY